MLNRSINKVTHCELNVEIRSDGSGDTNWTPDSAPEGKHLQSMSLGMRGARGCV